jgi:hypothetical protein
LLAITSRFESEWTLKVLIVKKSNYGITRRIQRIHEIQIFPS